MDLLTAVLAIALAVELYYMTKVLRRLQELECWRERVCFVCDMANDALHEKKTQAG